MKKIILAAVAALTLTTVPAMADNDSYRHFWKEAAAKVEVTRHDLKEADQKVTDLNIEALEVRAEYNYTSIHDKRSSVLYQKLNDLGHAIWAAKREVGFVKLRLTSDISDRDLQYKLYKR